MKIGNELRHASRLAKRPMRGRYLVQSLSSYALISIIDGVLGMLPIQRQQPFASARKVLLASWAHAGDLVLSLPAADALRQIFPRASISMLAGSWSRGLVEASASIEKAYYVDHWRLNRDQTPLYEKVMRYGKMRAAAVRAIKNEGFDIAIDVYPFFPPAHPLFYAANVPVRVGFSSGGFAGLLTHAVEWKNASRPISECYIKMLKYVFQQEVRTSGPVWDIENFDLPRPLSERGFTNFIVVHPGAGARFKEWSFEEWRNLIRILESEGEYIVITGSGKREAEIASRLMMHASRAINLVGLTSWREFLGTVAHARCVFCTDSVAGHVAAVFESPAVSIFTGANDVAQWAPKNPRGKVLVADTRCSPCYQPGCSHMSCIRGVTAERVMKAFHDVTR